MINRPSPAASLILVVDDDPEVREMVVDVLSGNGFDVLEAESGEAALALLEREPRISLLFTDVLMPGISGTILARRAMEMRPDLKVVLTSGYMRNERLSGLPVVPKPYRIGDLVRTVHAALV